MSKKRAFVRYTKSGEIVPGSLIITTNGGYPDKSSLWKEVTTNECCDGGGCNVPPVTVSTTATGFPVLISECDPFILFECDGSYAWEISGYLVGPIVNPFSLEDYIERLNTSYSWVGIWTLDGTTVALEMNGGVASALCPTGELTMIVGISCPA